MASNKLHLVCFVWLREAKLVLKNPFLIALLLCVPIGYTILFGSIYWYQRVLEIPTVVQDEDHSSLSRKLIQAIDASDSFHVIGTVPNLDKFRELAWRREAYMCIVIPPQLQHNLVAGKPARIMAVVEGTNMIIENAATRAVAEIAQTFSVGVSYKKWLAKGIPIGVVSQQSMPLELGARLWYNPTFNYTNFLVLGLIGTIIQQIILLVVALAWSKEQETGTIIELMQEVKSPAIATIGKLLFYFLPAVAVALISMIIAFTIYSVPQIGNAAVLVFATMVFIFGLIGLGFFVSSITGSQLLSTEILMIIAVPSFLISGFTWPLFAMPGWVRFIGELLPLTHYLIIVKSVALEGAGWLPNIGELLWLSLFAGLFYILQFISFSRLLNRVGNNK
ncbi:MAG: ABC transporter permease [bacterium]